MLESLILGIIQGLTEFFPVSSSAHVLLFEKLLNKENLGQSFAAGIHLATALALIIYFRRDLWNIIKSFIKFKDPNVNDDRLLGIKIIIATIPVILLGFIIDKIDFFQHLAENLFVMGVSSVVFGVVLYITDQKSIRSATNKKEITKADSFIIGASQIIAAIFPGGSRSGISFTSSFWRNIDREVAAKFVFLIAIPATALPGIYDILIKHKITLDNNFFTAFAAAFFSGLFAIYFLLKLIKKSSLKWFCYYRIVLGLAIIFYGLYMI